MDRKRKRKEVNLDNSYIIRFSLVNNKIQISNFQGENLFIKYINNNVKVKRKKEKNTFNLIRHLFFSNCLLDMIRLQFSFYRNITMKSFPLSVLVFDKMNFQLLYKSV